MEKKPLYQEILQDLKQDILSGKYLVEDKLPTELELSEKYQVSRITSKRALVELENEGLIYRLRGKGSFVKGQTKNQTETIKNDILFIMPFPDNTGLGDYTKGILRCLDQTDYRLIVQPHQFLSSTAIDEIIGEYAGIIYYPTNNHSNLDLLFSLHLNKVPTILLDKEFDSLPFTAVVADNQQGGFEATELLLKQGHQKIAFLSSEPLSAISSVRERYFGYLKALHQNGQNQPVHICKAEEDLDWDQFLRKAVEQLTTDQVTGIVVENDLLAIHLINLLKQLGYAVPDDFAVIGFDNIQAASLLEPGLTTLAQNFTEMGYLAAQKLVEEIQMPGKTPEKIIVDVALIERKSSEKKL